MKPYLHALGLALLTSAAATFAQTPPPPVAPPTVVTPQRSGVTVRHGDMTTSIVALTPEIVRVRVAKDGAMPEDASWAVLPAMRGAQAAVRPFDTGDAAGFATAKLKVSIDKRDGRMTVSDPQGRVISADAAPIAIDGAAFTLAKAMPLDEHYFGLGDKTGPLDRRGHSFVDWNTDVGGYDEATDPLYKSIPFFVAAGGAGGAYGIFLDNSWRAWFDFGQRRPDRVSFGANDGPIDYYLIAGPRIADVVARYGDLTGRAPLPPRWAFGYQQSRYSYMSADEVRRIAGRLRSEKIPTDVIWMDIDFQDRNRPFTTNPKTFPDLAGLAREMKGQGIKLVTITDLHVAKAENQGYAPYDSGAAGDHFVKNADGSVLVGEVWPGASVFPDFTRAASRAWWGSLYKGFVDAGVAGFWNDMNEPALFNVPGKTMPIDALHRIEGSGFAPRTATHAEIHNVYGMENSRATFEGLLKLRPDSRPFVMTRASYAGGQRYATTWTGDNSSTWSHFKMAVSQMLNMGLSGYTYTATDVGGFSGGASPEMLTRWYQIQAFAPLFREHAANTAPRSEPWFDGPAHLAIRKRFIEERYRLMPYLYGLADENWRTNAPVMRPVFYDYPDAPSLPCNQSMAFTLGAALLVTPSPTPESPTPYRACLPAGGWYDYWTGTRIEGAARMETPAIDRLPVFVRAGSILPKQPLVQSLDEVPQGPLELHVYPGDDCRGTLYADDGASLGYQRGQYARQAVRCRIDGGAVELTFDRRQGAYAPWWRSIAVVVHGWSGGAVVTEGGRAVASSVDPADGTMRFVLQDRGQARVLRASPIRS